MLTMLVIAVSYVIGSIPTGLWVGRQAGVDVRAHGSGNTGATNVARTAGWRLGVVTLLIDAAKGAVPVMVVWSAGLGPWLSVAAGLAAFFGHIFSIFASFRGGKGVATAAGAFAVLSPGAMAGAAALFAVTVWRFRIVSLASIAAAIALPLLTLTTKAETPISAAAAIVAAVIVATHRTNISRLLAGSEPKFSQPPRA